LVQPEQTLRLFFEEPPTPRRLFKPARPFLKLFPVKAASQQEVKPEKRKIKVEKL
jgi:hypothetical protein